MPTPNGLGAQQGRGLGHQLVEMVDGGVRGKFVERIRRIAETHQDRGHARALGRAEVHVAVSDHDGARRHATGERDHLGQVARVGLRYGESLAPGHAVEVMLKPKRLEQLAREIFALVGQTASFAPAVANVSSEATAPGKGRLSTAMFAS
jgi:hypothetical protein